MKPEYPFDREHGEESFDGFQETQVGGIQDEVSRMVVGSEFGGKATTQTSSVYDQVIFAVSRFESVVNELHVIQHVGFAPLAGAFSKTSVIDQYNVVIVSIEIARVFGPSFDASGISVEVQHQSFWVGAMKMQSINANPRLYIEEILPERGIVLEYKIGTESFRLEEKFLL